MAFYLTLRNRGMGEFSETSNLRAGVGLLGKNQSIYGRWISLTTEVFSGLLFQLFTFMPCILVSAINFFIMSTINTV